MPSMHVFVFGLDNFHPGSRKRNIPHRQDDQRFTAEFMRRAVADAIMARVSMEKEIEQLRERVPEDEFDQTVKIAGRGAPGRFVGGC